MHYRSAEGQADDLDAKCMCMAEGEKGKEELWESHHVELDQFTIIPRRS